MNECQWREDENGVYETLCGHTHEFISGGPLSYGFRFCPYCAMPVKDIPYVEQPDSGDNDEF